MYARLSVFLFSDLSIGIDAAVNGNGRKENRTLVTTTHPKFLTRLQLLLLRGDLVQVTTQDRELLVLDIAPSTRPPVFQSSAAEVGVSRAGGETTGVRSP